VKREIALPRTPVDRAACQLMRLLTLVCDLLGVLLLVAVLLLIVSAVVARDLLQVGMPWAEEVATLLAIYGVGFG